MDVYKLSKREVEVIYLLSQGYGCTEISEKLNISINTVKFHSHNIVRKINAKNIKNAIYIAHKMELI
ncbi:helix-turn-helix transcriptional regulator [Klebsiella grimontii]|uniref:helix-turn-helix transcriptional regulator n=1 Tax=Klebsiella grimontii TaxID=2058152 RepID=UPI0022451FE9|nr:helix-turn-helix transcriptional regulator [Klebsiella grimontii]MCW9528856.1 helix-turn-helix transcriptional regulator [Klebsiella grimontii]